MRFRPLRVLGFLALCWLTAAAALVGFAAVDLQRGIAEVDDARSSLGLDDLATPRPAEALGRARIRFGRASSRLSNPLLAPARILPIAGRQLRTVSALAGSARVVAEAGQRAALATSDALAAGENAGGDRLVLLERIDGILDRTESDLEALDLGPSEALVEPVARRRDRFARELDEARTGLAGANSAVAALRDLLGGPRRYLVLAGNNAEMRAGSGAFLSVGVLTTRDGTVALGEFESAGDLLLDPPGPAMEADLAARWGWAEPNREWRNLGVTPRFDVTGALAAAMWESRTGERVDGVLALDVGAVAAVLRATGAVEVDGETIDAERVIDLLMHDQYVEGEAELGGAQTERRERLGQIAAAAVGAVEAGDFELAELGTQLVEAAAGRHVLLWAADSAVQVGWGAAGIDGAVDGDALLVGVVNRGANKLDRFLAVESRLSTRPADGGRTTIELQIELDNPTPAGEIPYIAGPSRDARTAEGEYAGILAVTLPGAAADPTFGDLPLVVAGRDGASNVIGVEVRVPRGEARTSTLTFTMPGRTGSMRLLPSARILPIEWRRGDQAWNDGLGRPIRW